MLAWAGSDSGADYPCAAQEAKLRQALCVRWQFGWRLKMGVKRAEELCEMSVIQCFSRWYLQVAVVRSMVIAVQHTVALARRNVLLLSSWDYFVLISNIIFL